LKKKLRVALTYNIKKGTEPPESLADAGLQRQVSKINNSGKYIDKNLIENYPERIDDTFAEWDSEETIDAVRNALSLSGNNVYPVEADENAFSELKENKPDIVFNVAEGLHGASRESQIPSLLEMLDIPFTGSDSITTGICHDKSRCKEILSYYRIPNPAFFITGNIINTNGKLKFPKFVKPLHEGSSKGIYNSSVVNNLKELNEEIVRIKECYDQPSLVEDFLSGKEFTAAMLGNGDEVRVLPVVEINLDLVPQDFNKIYSYEVKWFFDTRENQLDIFHCPAKVSQGIYSSIEKVCKETFKVLRLRDWARIDIRLDEDNVPNIIEINPLPGILPDPKDNSCYPKAAREAGMDYNRMINAVLDEAIKRYK